jgi:hypothetical protein
VSPDRICARRISALRPKFAASRRRQRNGRPSPATRARSMYPSLPCATPPVRSLSSRASPPRVAGSRPPPGPSSSSGKFKLPPRGCDACAGAARSARCFSGPHSTAAAVRSRPPLPTAGHRPYRPASRSLPPTRRLRRGAPVTRAPRASPTAPSRTHRRSLAGTAPFWTRRPRETHSWTTERVECPEMGAAPEKRAGRVAAARTPSASRTAIRAGRRWGRARRGAAANAAALGNRAAQR